VGISLPWLFENNPIVCKKMVKECWKALTRDCRNKGDTTLHLLQIPITAAAAWLLFVGTMAVTGNWL
jgi:hypothetical protein